MRISRELEGVGRAMNSMTTQNNLMDFLNDQENSQRLNGLVEDIRYSLINYRVCTLKHSLSSYLTSTSDFTTTRYQ